MGNKCCRSKREMKQEELEIRRKMTEKFLQRSEQMEKLAMNSKLGHALPVTTRSRFRRDVIHSRPESICTPLRLNADGTFVPFDLATESTNQRQQSDTMSSPAYEEAFQKGNSQSPSPPLPHSNPMSSVTGTISNNYFRSVPNGLNENHNFDCVQQCTTNKSQPSHFNSQFSSQELNKNHLPFLLRQQQQTNLFHQQTGRPVHSEFQQSNEQLQKPSHALVQVDHDYEDCEVSPSHTILDYAADRIFHELQYMQRKVDQQPNSNGNSTSVYPVLSECPCYLPLAGSITQLQKQLQQQQISPIVQPQDLMLEHHQQLPPYSLHQVSNQHAQSHRLVACSTPAGAHPVWNHLVAKENCALECKPEKDAMPTSPFWDANQNEKLQPFSSQLCLSCGRLPDRSVPPLPSEPWFFARLSNRTAAEHVLCMLGNRAGAFLVRHTQQTGWSASRAPYVLSLLVQDSPDTACGQVLRNARSCGSSGLASNVAHSANNVETQPQHSQHSDVQQKSLRNRFSLPVCLERLPLGNGLAKSHPESLHTVAKNSNSNAYPKVLHYKIFKQRLCERCDCAQYYIDRLNRFDSIRLLVRFYSESSNGLPVRLTKPCLPPDLPFDKNFFCDRSLKSPSSDHSCSPKKHPESPVKTSPGYFNGQTQQPGSAGCSREHLPSMISSKRIDQHISTVSSISESNLTYSPTLNRSDETCSPSSACNQPLNCVVCEELRRSGRANRWSLGSLCALPETDQEVVHQTIQDVHPASALCSDHNGWLHWRLHNRSSRCIHPVQQKLQQKNNFINDRRLSCSADPLLTATTRQHSSTRPIAINHS